MYFHILESQQQKSLENFSFDVSLLTKTASSSPLQVYWHCNKLLPIKSARILPA